MDEAKSVKKIREQLYSDVWAEPMTAVAKKYNLSDSGVRKRCKSLNIPVPPFGYWAKKKAGKAVAERPPLPPYNEIILNNDIQTHDQTTESLPMIKKGSLELRDLDDLQIEQVAGLNGLDLIAPESLEYFNNWLDSIAVPGRVNDYDSLISRHKSEIEYRQARDKAYPFRSDHIKLWTAQNKVNERNNISVLPIEVSSGQLSRSYRIADTIIKTLRKLKATISVTNNDKDNVSISLLSSTVSFEISESKSKRRHLANLSDTQEFRPLYEEVFDGNLRISWQITGYQAYSYYSNSNKTPSLFLEYSDSKNHPLENQMSLMIVEVYKQCCDNELKHIIEKKKWQQKYEYEEKERLAKEEAQNLRKLEEKKQTQIKSLVNNILEQSNSWYKHKRLTEYADELDKYIDICSDAEIVRLLRSYIKLVRENVEKLNPIKDILDEMRTIEGTSS